MSVATYVFIDLETTGMPSEEGNKTKITELSMVAVKREHLLETRPGAAPRVQNKLTLCFNPRKLVHPECTKVTGLCNDLLEYESDFNIHVFNIINTFLNIQTKPVCLIAQNGFHFDFPILKRHIDNLKTSLSSDLLSADCYHGFYDILEDRKNRDSCDHAVAEIETEKQSVLDLFDMKSTLCMKSVNETTPKKKMTNNTQVCRKISKARRRLPWGQGSKPKDSYKLKDIYDRLLNRPALEAHRAENDCIMALECAVVLGKDFVKWVDVNSVLFSEVKPMTIGVPLGM